MKMKRLLPLLLLTLVLLTATPVLAMSGEDPGPINIWSYILDNAYVLAPVLYILGIFLKGTPKIPDWIIPWVLLVVGIVAAMFIIGPTAQGVIQGVLVAGLTVLTNQLIKQTKSATGG